MLLLSEPGVAYDYAESEPSLRKLLNRAIFDRILIQVVDGRLEVEAVPQELFELMVKTARDLTMAPDAPPDILFQAHQAVQGPRRPRRATNEPRRLQRAPEFARRANGGEGGIRTRDGV